MITVFHEQHDNADVKISFDTNTICTKFKPIPAYLFAMNSTL